MKGPVGSVDPDVVESGLGAWEQAQQQEKTEKKKAMVEYLFKEDPDRKGEGGEERWMIVIFLNQS